MTSDQCYRQIDVSRSAIVDTTTDEIVLIMCNLCIDVLFGRDRIVSTEIIQDWMPTVVPQLKNNIDYNKHEIEVDNSIKRFNAIVLIL